MIFAGAVLAFLSSVVSVLKNFYWGVVFSIFIFKSAIVFATTEDVRQAPSHSLSHQQRISACIRAMSDLEGEAKWEKAAEAVNLWRQNLPETKAQLKVTPERRIIPHMIPEYEGRYDAVPNGRTKNIMHFKQSGKPINYGGIDYIEFTNTTILSGYEIVRGIRSGYEVDYNLEDGSISTRNYLSDGLVFKIMPDGKRVFVNRIITSIRDGKTNFAAEDIRAWRIKNDWYISMTDYDQSGGLIQKDGNPEGSVRNGFLKVEFDKDGVPIAFDPKVRPAFHYFSPPPKRFKKGPDLFIDAKNGLIAENANHQIVVITRFRPPMDHPYMKGVSNHQDYEYAEQAFTFRSFEEMKAYDWSHAIDDLYDFKRAPHRVQPLFADTLMTNNDLIQDHYQDPAIAKNRRGGNKNGLGTGSRPQVIRRGAGKDRHRIFYSEFIGGPETEAKNIPTQYLDRFPIQEGDTKFFDMSHEILYYKRNEIWSQRRYDAPLIIRSSDLRSIDLVIPALVQPDPEHEVRSGILDLQHAYPMGAEIKKKDGVGLPRFTGGFADAHTGEFYVDVVDELCRSTESDTNAYKPRRRIAQEKSAR